MAVSLHTDRTFWWRGVRRHQGDDFSEASDYWARVINHLRLTETASAPETPESGPGADMFADASPLYLGTVVTTNNEAATAEAGEQDHAGETTAHSLWWKFECETTEQVALSLVGSSFDTLMQTYTGGPALNDLVQGPGNDDAFGLRSALRLDVEAGTTYYIVVDAPFDAGGVVRLELHANPEDNPYYLLNFSQGLTELDLSGFSDLVLLHCESNLLTTLDLSANPLLRGLRCKNNQLTTLDISGNPLLSEVDCSGNQLTQAAVDGVLTTLDANGLSNGRVKIFGGSNAAPSASGLAAKASLQGRGWVVLNT